jgi:hypothetical protein
MQMEDFLALMVLKRSLALIFGFTSLIRAKNFVSATPLVRLQIDNLLRFRAAFMVEDKDKFVASILDGVEVRQMPDRYGNRMTDAYLQNKLSSEYPWLKDLYKQTSGYIHLSEQHFLNTVRAKKGGQEGEIEVYIGPDDKMVSPEVYSESVETMILVTYELLKFLGDWAANA